MSECTEIAVNILANVPAARSVETMDQAREIAKAQLFPGESIQVIDNVAYAIFSATTRKE